MEEKIVINYENSGSCPVIYHGEMAEEAIKNTKSVLTVVDNGKPLTNSDMLNELSRAEKILNVIGNGVEKINYYVDTVQEIFLASYNVLRNAVLSGEKISVPALEPANPEKNKILVFEYGDKGAEKIGNLTSVSGEIDNIAGYHWEEGNGENISIEEQYEEFANAVIHYFHSGKNPEKMDYEKVFGTSEKINPADLYNDKMCVNCGEAHTKKYYEIPFIKVNKEKEQKLYGSNYICEECARKFSMIDVLSNIYDYK